MIYVHPVIGLSAALLLFWVGTQGLRARHRARYAAAARATHRRYAPYIYALVLVGAVAGTASVFGLRDDLRPATSWHFWIGWTVATLLTGGALTSKRIRTHASARRIHPWLGLAAMLLALLGAVLGFGMLP